MSPLRNLRLLLAAFLLITVSASAEQLRWSGVERVVAFADVHGAYDELVDLLQRTGVLDQHQTWAGGNSHLVSTGDLVDRGGDSRKVMDLLMRLQDEAAQAGGKVHVLLGNHELMNLTGDLRYVDDREYLAFLGEELPGVRQQALTKFIASSINDALYAEAEFNRLYPPGYFGHRAAFAPDGKYGRWLLERPLMVVINRTAFTHGGLPPLIASIGLEQTNAILGGEFRKFVRLWHELIASGIVAAEVDAQHSAYQLSEQLTEIETNGAVHADAIRQFVALSNSDIFDNDGPLWYRGTALCHPVLERSVTAAALQTLDVDRIVVGHSPTHDHHVDRRIDDRVFVLDTGMLGKYYGGVPAALTIENDVVSVTYGRGHTEPGAPDNDELERILAEADYINYDENSQTALFADNIVATFIPRPDHQLELAAYRIDRLLGFDLVPVTVERVISGRRGALSLRPNDFITENDRVADNKAIPNVCANGNEFELMYVFDALLGNDGRTRESMLYHDPNMRLAITDFAKAFKTSDDLPVYLQQAELSLSAEMAGRLSRLNTVALKAAVGDLLSKRQIKALIKRRDEILNTWPRNP